MFFKLESETEIVNAISQSESDVSGDAVAREYGISRTTLYKWRTKHSDMDVIQECHLKELEEESRKLKQMYADLTLDNQILCDVIEKKL